MAKPFQTPRDGSAAGSRSKSACRDQLEQVLAEAETIQDISGREIAEIAARHGLNLARQLRAARREMYRRFLEHCLLDYALSPEELADLGHLREILHLEDWEAAGIHDEVCRRVYGAALDIVLDDGRLDPEEEAFMRRLREDLEIPLVAAEGMMQKALREVGARPAGPDGDGPPPAGEPVELQGMSEKSLEEAIRRALSQASPPLRDRVRVELSRLEVEVRDGEPASWVVHLEAPREPGGGAPAGP